MLNALLFIPLAVLVGGLLYTLCAITWQELNDAFDCPLDYHYAAEESDHPGLDADTPATAPATPDRRRD